jgi:predicted transposase YbfD/YdcC
MDMNTQVEHTRSREVKRTVSVLARPRGIGQEWVGVERIAKVDRTGTRGGEPFDETVFYISSLQEDAAGFARRIRDHWQIENCLHWPKDVVLKEDQAPLCDGHALINFAIVRTIVVNIFRREGFTSITKGIRYLAHDIHRLFSFLQ